MDDFLLQNAARHQALVARFKPSNAPPTADNAGTNPNIVVATRIRPMLEEELSSGQVPATFPREDRRGVVDIHQLRRVVRGPPPLNSFSYQAGKVFGANASTETVYEDLVHPLLPYAWNANIGTLFAYGQTGSGKTYTAKGIAQFIARTLFDGTLPGQRTIRLGVFELAGNSAFDLLKSRAPFPILEDAFGDTQLVGVEEKTISSPSELVELIDYANTFRQTASTEKNDSSSRSHAICRIRLENPAPEAVEPGILYIVDLAGSEAARDIFNHGADRMKETREINISLSILKECFRGISIIDAPTEPGKQAKKPYIPFRQSMLTKVLKHLFDPASNRECKTAVLACVNPSFLDAGATKNTLRYAEMLLMTRPVRKPAGHNPAAPSTWSNQYLRKFIEQESGDPPISPSELAPHETGRQLLQLPTDEFIDRCLQIAGVNESRARLFHAKLWKMHIDSRSYAK